MNWLFPYAVSTTTAPSDPPSSPALSAVGDHQDADSVSSRSAASFSSSSSSSTDHFTFATTPGQRSPSASPLCFGAGKLLWRSSNGVARAQVPRKQEAPKGDVVGRYLRKISVRLRKARAAAKESSPPPPPPPCRGAAADDTARERAEAVASAVAYCKASLWRGSGASTARPASSPSLDCWLQGWQEEIIASAAATPCNEECTDKHSPPLRQAGWILERHANATLRKESPRPPSPSRDVSLTASAVVAVGKESPKFCGEAAMAGETAKSSSPSDPVHREFNTSSSFNEIEFMKTFNEEEIIGRHFITIRI